MVKELNSLRPYIDRKDKWKFVALLFLMLIAGSLEAVGLGTVPVFVMAILEPARLTQIPKIGHWFVNLPTEPNFSILFWGCLILLTTFLVKNLYLIGVAYVQTRLVENQRVKLSSRVFQAYQKAPYEWHLGRNAAELIRNINEDTRTIIQQILMPALDLIMALVITVATIGILIAATPGITLLACLIVGGGIGAIVLFFKKKLRQIGDVTKEEREKSSQAVLHAFGAISDARILNANNFLYRKFKGSVTRISRAQAMQALISKVYYNFVELIAIFGMVVVILSLFLMHDELNSQMPLLSLFAITMVRLKQSMTSIAAKVGIIQFSRASIPHIVSDLKTIEELEQQSQKSRTGAKIPQVFESLKLKNCTYFYPDSDKSALESVSLELNKGESIAFIGPTGCGKSTLIKCILGLIKPQSGTICVNGVSIQDDLQGWYCQVGYIPQSIYLIDDSIRANIAFGQTKEQTDDALIWEALQSASIEDFVRSLPKGLDTVVGENGVRLSGGQRQRLGIARALYRRPQVVIMDEGTSALDNQTETEVMQAINNLQKERTLIMIAHRLSTIESCDRIYKMEAGQIIQHGTSQNII